MKSVFATVVLFLALPTFAETSPAMAKILEALSRVPAQEAQKVEEAKPAEDSSPKSPTTWQTSCYNIDDDVLRQELLDEGTSWRHRHIAYEKENCEAAYLFYDIHYKVKQDGAKIDLTHIATAYTPLTAEVAEALNLIRWCGLDGWKKDEAQSIAGQECGDFKVPSKGQMLYSIFELKNDGKDLFLGEATVAKPGTTPENRHEKLSTRAFQK
jgi:hypothetical protein